MQGKLTVDGTQTEVWMRTGGGHLSEGLEEGGTVWGTLLVPVTC